MKNFRKTLAILMSLLCIPSFAACNEKDNSESSSNANNDEQSATTEDEASLGEYVLSEKGTKLYYSSDEFSPELMAVLEKYFIAFSEGDYESYEQCVQSDYIDAMNTYLEADYGYDLETSFQNQCDSLKENAGGDYKITRIKAELPEEDGTEAYLNTLGDIFETDFYDIIQENSDELHDVIFYVMTETDGEEILLLSEFEIVFAEKDGQFYTFG